jgi:hypothetical protein
MTFFLALIIYGPPIDIFYLLHESVLRLQNLQLQRQRFNRLDRQFSKEEENIYSVKTH